MGDYITNSELNIDRTILIYLTRAEGTNSPDNNVIDPQILVAEGIVKAHVGMTYEIPLDDELETALIKDICRVIVIRNLYKERQSKVPEERESDYNRVYADKNSLLNRIIRGEIKLGADTDDEDGTQTAPTATFERS